MLEKTLRFPWTARRSNLSILKEIIHDYSLERLMLKLKLQYLIRLIQRANSLEKTLMLGKIESRRRGWQDEIVGWHHQLNGHEFEQTQGDSEGQGSLACSSPWSCKESDTTQWLNKTKQTPQSWPRNKKLGDIKVGYLSWGDKMGVGVI